MRGGGREGGEGEEGKREEKQRKSSWGGKEREERKGRKGRRKSMGKGILGRKSVSTDQVLYSEFCASLKV